MSDIYWEKQKGGLCRKHALNAFFGEEKITESDFIQNCQEFDEYMKKKGYEMSSTLAFDQVHSSQESIISYILRKHDIYSLLIPFNYKIQRNINDVIEDSENVFIFNANHIWLLKLNRSKTIDSNRSKNDSNWLSINSMGGVSNFGNIAKIRNMKNHGFIVVKNNPNTDLKYYQSRISSFFKNISIEEKINEIYDSKNILGDIELYMTLCYEIIQDEDYYNFLIKYEKDRLNKNLVLQYVPYFIDQLIDRIIP